MAAQNPVTVTGPELSVQVPLPADPRSGTGRPLPQLHSTVRLYVMSSEDEGESREGIAFEFAVK